jgi:hypothetical protein
VQAGAPIPEIAGLDIRRTRVHRFPYHVAYMLVDGDELSVLAVAHDRRRPGYWSDRVGEE